MTGVRRRLALLLALAAVTGCTQDRSGEDLSASLVRPEQLSGQWEAREPGATQVAGGFCDVAAVVERTAPQDQAVTVLVDGELLVRDTRLRYAGTADAAYEALSARLSDCGADPESRQLRLAVEPLAVPTTPGGRSAGFRLRLPVAGTVLLLDLAVWQRGSLLGLTRLTHPQDGAGAAGRLAGLVGAAQGNAVTG